MTIKHVLLLGNPQLYELSQPVRRKELTQLSDLVTDLHDTLMDFKKRYGGGRAIAAPQIGTMKRLVYMYIDKPVVLVNPTLNKKSKEMIAIWDDCMSFIDLLVKVKRYSSCNVTYRDMDWTEQEMSLQGDLSELLQHECDHLDGILAVSRAVDQYSFALRSQKRFIEKQNIVKNWQK